MSTGFGGELQNLPPEILKGIVELALVGDNNLETLAKFHTSGTDLKKNQAVADKIISVNLQTLEQALKKLSTRAASWKLQHTPVLYYFQEERDKAEGKLSKFGEKLAKVKEAFKKLDTQKLLPKTAWDKYKSCKKEFQALCDTVKKVFDNCPNWGSEHG